MCGSSDRESDDVTSASSSSRRLPGTRRRQLEWVTNFVLVVVSLFGISVGSGLLAFYKLHLLSFVSVEFMVVPLVLLGGGGFTLLVSIVGLVATSKRSPCLLIFYALLLLLAFIVLIAGVACSVRIIFIIFHGIEHYVSALAIPLVKRYGKDAYATSTWDALHGAYRCCGVETTYDLGYMVWERSEHLQTNLAVPDSCCLKPDLGCGHRVFEKHRDMNKLAGYFKRIYVHGCVGAMDNVLKEHVVPILSVFSISGSILAMAELLGVVLACCLADVLAKENKLKKSRQRIIARQHSQERLNSISKSYIDTSL